MGLGARKGCTNKTRIGLCTTTFVRRRVHVVAKLVSSKPQLALRSDIGGGVLGLPWGTDWHPSTVCGRGLAAQSNALPLRLGTVCAALLASVPQARTGPRTVESTRFSTRRSKLGEARGENIPKAIN